MARKPAKKSGISVDFSGVESSAGTIPEGDYILEVDEVEIKTSENSGHDYLAFTFKVQEGEYEGKKVYHNCSLQPQALFNLKNLLEAMGWEIPDGALDFEPEDLIGNAVGATTGIQVYEGKKRAQIVEFFSAEEVEEEGKPAAKKPDAKKSAAKEPEKPAAKKPAAKKSKPSFTVGQKVNFIDEDGDEITGKIIDIDEDEGTASVKVGKEEWEIELEELTAA